MNSMMKIERASHYRANPLQSSERSWESVTAQDIEPGDVLCMSAYADTAAGMIEAGEDADVDFALLWETREVVQSTSRINGMVEVTVYIPRNASMDRFTLSLSPRRTCALAFTGSVELED